MTQEDALQATQKAIMALDQLYWAKPNVETQVQIENSREKLNTLADSLSKDDLSERTAEFSTAITQFNADVLPAILKLQVSLNQTIDRYSMVKAAIKDIELIQSVTSFLTIPVI